jgi:SMP-30/Gluconolactonase/LRE-like region
MTAGEGITVPASIQPEIVFDGHAAIGGGAGIGDRQQRLMWLDIPHGRVHRFDPATGSDDVFRVGKPVGAVGLHTGKIKMSGRLSGKWRSRGLVRRLRVPACARVRAGQTIYLGVRNRRAIHGKEKVYGSIRKGAPRSGAPFVRLPEDLFPGREKVRCLIPERAAGQRHALVG